MSFVPYIQYSNNIVPWDFKKPVDSSYIITNISLFLANLFFFVLTFKRTTYINSHYSLVIDILYKNNKKNLNFPILPVALSLISCGFWFAINGIPTLNQLIFRVADSDNVGMELTSSISLLSETIRYIPFMSFLIYYINFPKSKILNIVFIFIIIVTCPPTAISRFMAGTIYFTILVLFYPRLLIGYRLPILIALGFAILFPIIDELRVFTRDINLINALSFKYFLTGNYDSYNSLAVAIDQNVITYGKQLLGVLLFFIPRVLWNNKPVGSGSYIADLNHLNFTNISFNYYAEGFINFGFLGIIFFSIILGLVVKFIESTLRLSERNKYRQFYVILYLILIPYILFILRGDLMSSISFFCAILFSLIFVFFSQKSIFK
jgi:oligosaccharide repeat unit polymerase